MKPWQENVAINLRNHLVNKLVQAIFSDSQPEVFNDQQRMTNLIYYARKVEMDKHKAANSGEEYYQMLAEKISRIQAELEAKRESRQRQDQAAGNKNRAS